MNVLRELCETLQPDALFTNEMQASYGTSGMVLPALDIVNKELDEMSTKCVNNNPLSTVLSNILNKRFQAIKLDKFYWISTCLDPRFGTQALENIEYLNVLKSAMNIVLDLERKAFEIKNTHPVQESTIKEEPSLKRRKSLFPVKSYTNQINHLHSTDIIEMKITLFKAEARNLDGLLEVDPITWLEKNTMKLPLMEKLAKVFLLPPASTSDVERLFSVAGRICRPHRQGRIKGHFVRRQSIKLGPLP